MWRSERIDSRTAFFLIYGIYFPSSCSDIVPFLYAVDTNCVQIRPENATSTLQDDVEYITLWMSKHNWSVHVRKTELAG